MSQNSLPNSICQGHETRIFKEECFKFQDRLIFGRSKGILTLILILILVDKYFVNVWYSFLYAFNHKCEASKDMLAKYKIRVWTICFLSNMQYTRTELINVIYQFVSIVHVIFVCKTNKTKMVIIYTIHNFRTLEWLQLCNVKYFERITCSIRSWVIAMFCDS